MKTLKLFNIAAMLLLFSLNVNAQWRLLGNSGTDPSINFLGTTDAKPLVFKVNNQKAGYLGFDYDANTAFGYQSLFSSYGSHRTQGNTAIGSQALYENINGVYNTAIGTIALYGNTSGEYNTAIGAQSLQSNTEGTENTATGANSLFLNATGSFNTATGTSALESNLTGSYNTAIGGYALLNNFSGNSNTATGISALNRNLSGYENTANGFRSIFSNTDGYYNTAVGSYAMYNNTKGFSNTANGVSALYSNTTGALNAATGLWALYANTDGYWNTANGVYALKTNTEGYANTAVGYRADIATGTLSNATAIGAGAIARASNQIMLGNAIVESVMASGRFVIVSDGRFKSNLKENVPGLDFIKQLKPVTYHCNIRKLNEHTRGKEGEDSAALNGFSKTQMEEAITQKEKKLYTGFVAQEVEAAANKLGYDFSGVYKPQNEKDIYGLSYSDFVMPLVKAVQELSKENDDLKSEIRNLKSEMDQLKSIILSNSSTSDYKRQTTNLTSASLEQNIPNPFTHTTTIKYTLPQNFAKAQLVVSDKTGRVLKQMNLSGAGKGTTQINASALSSGAYNYSLYVDGRLINTKQLVLAK